MGIDSLLKPAPSGLLMNCRFWLFHPDFIFSTLSLQLGSRPLGTININNNFYFSSAVIMDCV